MKQAPESIYIITQSGQRAEEIKKALILRGFDEILCASYENAAILLRANSPTLAIIDMEGESTKVESLMLQMPPAVKSIVLNPSFNDALFLVCHDHGARDFLLTPVPDAYLVSCVIRILQENRMAQLVQQKDRILVEMGALSVRSGVFTTSYLLKLLKKQAEEVSPYLPDPLSLLIVQLQGFQSPLPEELHNPLMADVARILKESSRGMDSVGEYFIDKFAVILPNTGLRGTRALAKRLEVRLNGLEFQGVRGPARLRVAIGIAEYNGCRHYEDLITAAMMDLMGATSPSSETES